MTKWLISWVSLVVLLSCAFTTISSETVLEKLRVRAELLQSRTSELEGLSQLATTTPFYHSNDELEWFLRDYVTRCGHISRLYSIGQSVEGTTLWVLHIAANPHVDDDRFAFKYVGNLHGDEPVGRQLLLYLADWLCTNYPAHPQAQYIIDRVHLHLLPAMNPDGFQRHTRENARKVDLNRAFPDPWLPSNSSNSNRNSSSSSSGNNSTASRSRSSSSSSEWGAFEPEVAAVMRWSMEHKFAASASLHGGALVACYPWDGSPDKKTHYSASPDDASFRLLASTYALAHSVMHRSREFEGGISNGAAWYPLYGGMQDWMYLHTECLEITIELHNTKWPPPQLLPDLWADNRNALLSLVINASRMGVHGTVVSANSGHPLPATIRIEGVQQQELHASARHGHFYRVLAPGNYTLTITHPHHLHSSINLEVASGHPSVIRIALTPHSLHQLLHSLLINQDYFQSIREGAILRGVEVSLVSCMVIVPSLFIVITIFSRKRRKCRTPNGRTLPK